MEYSSRKSFVTAIRSYTNSRGVHYNVYEFEPQTFYAKYKTYGRGCDWLIRARFNYTISYRKAWLAKQKSVVKVFSGWKDYYQVLPWWFSVMV
ncbi:hypothetical protein Ahy_A09g045400 [Arachis hypogaea]|uniref:Transposase MuDR plant domain-containing protein n=1 Tax=Arachis hypogaea TaxID=3818 RepID=A0A445BMB9_ARAHY|nr:hypothetical protein Ahy_A09g045400 [Arachis hypogaea]